MQYTIIAEPKKNFWYPMWRDRDGQMWQYFLLDGEDVACPTESQAQDYIDTWCKTYPVLVISRAYLNSIGLTSTQVNSLSDEDMKRIAGILIAHFLDSEFDEEVKFTTRLVLEERRRSS